MENTIKTVLEELENGKLSEKSKALKLLCEYVGFQKYHYLDCDDEVDHIATLDVFKEAEEWELKIPKGLEKFKIESIITMTKEEWQKPFVRLNDYEEEFKIYINYKNEDIEIEI